MTTDAVFYTAVLAALREWLATADAATAGLPNVVTAALVDEAALQQWLAALTDESLTEILSTKFIDLVLASKFDAAAELAAQLGISFDVASLTSKAVLDATHAQIARTAQLIGDSVRESVRVVLSDSLAKGDGVAETARLIRKDVLDPSRALRIARTERAAALNAGQHDAAEVAWQAGVITGKTWSTVLDGRERSTHQHLDGVTIPFDARFSNGGRYPSDPYLPASESVNCRCVLTYTTEPLTAAVAPDAPQPDFSTGIMIALIPNNFSNATNDQHATLVFSGDVGPDAPGLDAMLAAVEAAASITPTISAPVTGVATLGDKDAQVALIESQEILDLHDTFAEFDRGGHPGFIQHVTSHYGDPVTTKADYPTEFVFDTLRLAYGPDNYDYPLQTDANATTAALAQIQYGSAWHGTLVVANTPTSDGRILLGTTTWRDLPLPLFWQPEQGAEGHVGAVQIGVIEEITLDGDIINGDGHLFADVDPAVLDIIASGSGQLSIDPAGADIVPADQSASGFDEYHDTTISGVTITAGPAAQDSVPGAERISLVASAFAPVRLTEPTMLQIETLADGTRRVFGHLAVWNSCHRGFSDRCVRPPRGDDFSNFHTTVRDGIPVGPLVGLAGHAGLNLTADQTKSFYDNVATRWAMVHAYEDEIGIAVSGRVLDGVTDADLDRFAAALSGDWRKVKGALRLHAALSVNTPGFLVASLESGDALIASAFDPESDCIRAQKAARLRLRARLA